MNDTEQRIRELADWLNEESASLAKQALSRRDMAALRDCTADDLQAGRELAEKMSGRKMPATSVEDNIRSCDVHDRIAAKLEAQSTRLTEWAALLSQIEEERKRIAELNKQVLAWEEREGSVCPEDVGFEELIGVLRKEKAAAEARASRAEQATKEAQGQLSWVDALLARRPALEDCSDRGAKIEKAIAVAAKCDAAESALTAAEQATVTACRKVGFESLAALIDDYTKLVNQLAAERERVIKEAAKICDEDAKYALGRATATDATDATPSEILVWMMSNHTARIIADRIRALAPAPSDVTEERTKP